MEDWGRESSSPWGEGGRPGEPSGSDGCCVLHPAPATAPASAPETVQDLCKDSYAVSCPIYGALSICCLMAISWQEASFIFVHYDYGLSILPLQMALKNFAALCILAVHINTVHVYQHHCWCTGKHPFPCVALRQKQASRCRRAFFSGEKRVILWALAICNIPFFLPFEASE